MTRRRSGKAKQKKQNQDQAVKWRRRRRLQPPKNQIPSSMSIDPETEKEDQEKEKCEAGGRRFFGCYLLTSLSPRFKGHTYIGFTVNPKRRIRQHNGEITSGAFRTKKKRPWEMVLCIHGFPTNVAALQFEWAWQHPSESKAVREAAATFKTLGGLANKIKLALTMLTLHSWQSMNLTVSFFSTKYMKHAAGCPSLPHQMKLHFCSMDELPCYGNSDHPYGFDEDDVNSNDSEVSANYSDERLQSPAGDSMESDNVNCTLKSPTDNVLVGDCLVFGGPMDNESSSMTGALEEHMQPLHQLPVDASGSENEWIPNLQPIGNIYASENEWIPNLQELRGSFPITEEDVLPFQQAGSSEREQSSMVDFVSVMEDTTEKDNVTYVIIDDVTEEQCQPTRVPSPIRFVSTVWPYSDKGIEVIELCTPSPEFRITTGSKRKRVISDFPDFIDLTGSPSFVQL